MSPRIRLAVLALGIGLAALLVFLSLARSPERIRDLVDGAGVAAPVLFCLITPFLSASFFPGAFIAGASGLLFGTALGTPVSIVAGTLSAALAFSISRHGGRGAVDELAGERVLRWQDWIERRGFVAVLYARIAPAMPFTLINYAAGVTRLRISVFLAATAIGISPRAFAYTALGGNFDNLGSPEAVVAIAVLVVMGVGGAGLALRDRRRSADAQRARRGDDAPEVVTSARDQNVAAGSQRAGEADDDGAPEAQRDPADAGADPRAAR